MTQQLDFYEQSLRDSQQAYESEAREIANESALQYEPSTWTMADSDHHTDIYAIFTRLDGDELDRALEQTGNVCMLCDGSLWVAGPRFGPFLIPVGREAYSRGTKC